MNIISVHLILGENGLYSLGGRFGNSGNIAGEVLNVFNAIQKKIQTVKKVNPSYSYCLAQEASYWLSTEFFATNPIEATIQLNDLIKNMSDAFTYLSVYAQRHDSQQMEIIIFRVKNGTLSPLLTLNQVVQDLLVAASAQINLDLFDFVEKNPA